MFISFLNRKFFKLLLTIAIILMWGVNVAVAGEHDMRLKVNDTTGNSISGAQVELFSIEYTVQPSGDGEGEGSEEESSDEEGSSDEEEEFYEALISETLIISQTLLKEAITNGDGTALFTDLPEGSYMVRISKDNMTNLPSVLELNNNDSSEVSIVLQPLKEFDLIGHILSIKDYRYNDQQPGPTISVNKGDLVRINFSVPEDDIAHTVYIDEFRIKLPGIPADSWTVIEFIADQAGEFYYYCALPSHRTLGMEGKIIVKDE